MLADLSEPQRELAKYMASISEAAYAASWIEGLEFELWRAVQGGAFLYGRLQLTSVHMKRLKELTQRPPAEAGGLECFGLKVRIRVA